MVGRVDRGLRGGGRSGLEGLWCSRHYCTHQLWCDIILILCLAPGMELLGLDLTQQG
eukprot:COSAG02_NODE_1570_length_11893_cov_2.376717_3_plen_57_part_00